jgi:hypothetical protein
MNGKKVAPRIGILGEPVRRSPDQPTGSVASFCPNIFIPDREYNAPPAALFSE